MYRHRDAPPESVVPECHVTSSLAAESEADPLQGRHYVGSATAGSSGNGGRLRRVGGTYLNAVYDRLDGVLQVERERAHIVRDGITMIGQ